MKNGTGRILGRLHATRVLKEFEVDAVVGGTSYHPDISWTQVGTNDDEWWVMDDCMRDY